jgi:mono/diheme cytochrome c family protein
LVQPGGTGDIGVTIDLAGKSGTLYKSAIILTDKGVKNLMLSVDIQPPPPPEAMTDVQRARALAAAKVDRQAVFKGDCIKCHANHVEGLYGQELFAAVCTVCHEAKPRPTMVPDLHNLKDPTSMEFWRAWITVGKPGSLMPAFSTSQGGPLNDVQINTLAAYLNSAIPPHTLSATK